MAEYLTRTVYGPDGAPGRRGSEPPDGWDEDFLNDLRARGALIDGAAHPHLALPLGTAADVEAAWAQVQGHNPDDIIAAVAADRVRAAAAAVGRHDIARDRGPARPDAPRVMGLVGVGARLREGGTR